MKNVHLLPTDKPSRLFKFANELHLDTIPKDYYKKYNIYITSDEEIKEGDKWVYNTHWNEPQKIEEDWVLKILNESSNTFKIILTTDQDLIKDGVQAIDDEFLEWFVKNSNCEWVEVLYDYFQVDQNNPVLRGSTSLVKQHKIIIPQESVCTLDALDTFENARLALRKHLLANKEKIAKDLKEIREKSNGIKQERVEEAANNFAKLLGNKHETIFALEENAFIEGAKWQAERMYSEEEVLELVLSRPGPYLTDEEIKEWFEQSKKK